MSQTVVTVDVGGTGANNANAALTNLGALPTFGGSISGNLNVASSLVVTGNANLGNYVVSGNSISTTQTNGDVVLTPKGTGRLRVRSKILSGNGAEAHFSSSGIDESSIGIGSFNDSNGAAELLIVNKNSGTLAYSEMIAINDTGDQDQGWISVGVNSSGYDDPEYTLTGPDDGYVLFEAPQGTSANGDLIIGTGSFGLNNKIVMAAGGFTPTDAQLVIMPADLKRANLTSYVVAANVVTFTTDTTHTFVANDIVAISGVGAPYDGTRTVTANTINTFNVSVTTGNIGPINLSPAGFAIQFLPFNKGTVELTAQLFVGENSRSTIETADITLAEGHAIPLGIVVDNDGPGQTVMFNKSNGTLAFSEFIAHNDQGNVHQGWISMGINSSGYDDPEFPITKEDDGYLLFEAPAGTTGGGDLIIGTGTNGQTNRLIFAAEGFDEANAQMIITPDESVRISIATDASSANTGALQVVGGVGVQGSMYVQGNQTIQGDLIVNGSQVIQSIENLAAAGPISLLSDGNIANTWDQGIVGTYAVSKTSNTHSVTFKAIANNTGTLTTANNHGFVAEDYVTVANVDVTFNGTHRITAATSNTISFFLLANNLSQTVATGTATVDKAARYTGLVKRASDGNWRFFSGLGTRPAFNTDFTDANLAFDSIIAGSADFRGSLKLGSPNTATIVYTDNNARTLTIPALAGNRTFAFINEAQTFTAAQAVSSTVTATKFIPTAGDATGNGLYLSGANKLGLTADGVERVSISASETVINDGSADYDFRVESDGNANMLFVDGGNNRVGIGTGSPNATLEVNGNIYLTSNSNFFLFGTNSAINPYIQGDTGGQKLFLGVNNGSALTIDSSRNVGIGTTNPTQKLSINGRFHSDTNNNYYGAWGEGNTAANGYSFFAVGEWYTTSLYIQKKEGQPFSHLYTYNNTHHIAMQAGSLDNGTTAGGGNVGIGTTNPAVKFHVYGDNNTTPLRVGVGTAATFNFSANSTSGYITTFNIDDTGLSIGHNSSVRDFRIQTNSLPRITILGDGKVGIGTTAPTSLFTLKGQGHSAPTLAIHRTDSSTEQFIIINAETSAFTTSRGTSSGTWTNILDSKNSNLMLSTHLGGGSGGKIFLDADFVGVGTTNPSYRLEVRANNTVAGFRSATSNAGITIEHATNGGTIGYINNGGGDYNNLFYVTTGAGTVGSGIVMDNGGRVGIGMTNPTQKLHVNGSVEIDTGNLRLDRDYAINWGSGDNEIVGKGGSDAYSLLFTTYDGISAQQEVMRVTGGTPASGGKRVGIGTTSPSAALHIAGTNNSAVGSSTFWAFSFVGQEITNLSNTTGSVSGLALVNGSTRSAVAAIGGILETTALSALGFFTGGSGVSGGTVPERMRITSGGNVLVGTNVSVANGGIVQIGQVPNSTSSSIGFNNGDNAVISARYSLSFQINSDNNISGRTYTWKTGGKGYSDGTDLMILTATGNLSIGTSSTTSRVSISGPNTGGIPLLDLTASGTGTFQRGVRLLNSGMNSGDHIMYAVGRSDNSYNMGQFYFYYAGAGSTSNRVSIGLHSADDIFNVTGLGNVGVNSSAPRTKLDVQVPDNSYAAIGVRQMAPGSWTGITFGYAESNDNYRKAALVFYRTDLSSPDGQGKVALCNAPQGTSTSVSYNDRRITINEAGTISFNNYGAGTLSTDSNGLISASDGRYKTKTREFTGGLSKILQLNPTYYRWKENSPFWEPGLTSYEELGFVAQEVAAVIPEASPEPEQEGKFKNYSDRAIIAALVDAIKELKAEIDSLKNK